MLKNLRKGKIFSLMLTFIFFFNITGLAGLAIAESLPEIGVEDNASLLNQTLQGVATNLKFIKNDINSGNDPVTHINTLREQYAELIQVRDSISIELEGVRTKVIGLSEQGTVTNEFVLRADTFTNQYHQDISGILESINNVLTIQSVEQIDAILEKIQTMYEVKGNILGADQKLPNRRANIPKRSMMIRSDRVVDINPTDADLAPSVDVRITPEIENLAEELNYDITDIFSYVRNTIDYQPYYGSLKGSVGTYWEKAGNDFDQSSFLIALLRASNVPARYVAGEIALPIHIAMNWVGANTPEAALEILTSSGIPAEAVMANDKKTVGLKFYHVWVEAYNSNNTWVKMDPSFKNYAYHKGIDISLIADIDINDLFGAGSNGAIVGDNYITGLNNTNMANKLALYKNSLSAYLEENISNVTENEILGYREITNRAKGILPPPENGGVFGISETKERFSEIPNTVRSKVNFQILGINYTMALPSVAEESIILDFVPATQADSNLIEYYGGIFNVPAFLIHMKPVLKVDGEVKAEGVSVGLGSNYTLFSSFLRPGSETWDTNNRGITVGATYSLNLDIQKMPWDLVEKRNTALMDTVENYPADEPATREMLEEMLHITGMAYFAQVDKYSDIAAKAQGIVWIRLASQAIVSQEVTITRLLWIPWKVSQGARSIDVKRNIVNPTSVSGDSDVETNWMIATGIIGSAAENRIFENLYNTESVSTIKILSLANEQSVPIYQIDSENIDTVLPEINTYGIVKNSIIEHVNNGYIVICPQRNITLNSWTGQGWMIVNPTDGSAGYLLAGSLTTNSDISIINGGSSTAPSEESPTGYDVEEFAVDAHHLAEISVMIGMMQVALLGVFCTLLTGSIIGFVVVGLPLLISALLHMVVLYTLLHEEMPDLTLLRRRRRIYA